MKKDFSEYQYTDYDKYLAVRSNRDGLHLDVFHNNVSFSPEDRKFYIGVDSAHEYYFSQKYIDIYEEDQSRRAGYPLRGLSAEEEKEIEEIRKEKETQNEETLARMQAKYHMDREQAEIERNNAVQIDGQTKEPFINVFSGSQIEMGYGEGLLDFIYADFVTPLRKIYAFFSAFSALREKEIEKRRKANGTEPAEQEPVKIYDENQEFVQRFLDYESTFNNIKDIAYASLYSSICPPRFDEGHLDAAAIRWYGNYLLALQKEYREMLEFCYDEDLYPEALGNLYPSERFALYRNYHDIPSRMTREETVSFSAVRSSGDKMPYGLPGSERIKLLTATPKITADHIALAEKLGTSSKQLAIRIQLRSFMSNEYNFSTIQDILELEFTKMLEQNIRFRKCRRCGRYFIMKGNYDTHYCDRIAEGETRTCQELAAAEKYKEKIADNKAIPIYNKYYKRYAARVKVRQIKEDDFKKWRYKAITLRDDCAEGKLTVEEYIQWMEDSFPNRKPKTKA